MNRHDLPHCIWDVCFLSWESEDKSALSPTHLPPNKIHYSYPNSGESIGINLDKNVFLTLPMNSMDKMEYHLLNGARKDSIRWWTLSFTLQSVCDLNWDIKKIISSNCWSRKPKLYWVPPSLPPPHPIIFQSKLLPQENKRSEISPPPSLGNECLSFVSFYFHISQYLFVLEVPCVC